MISIHDADIAWACEILGLQSDAFAGADGADPRQDILKCFDTIDVSACPGSGKTTVLVAKLAIMGRKWTQADAGLCVVSHTNAARREIEKGLGNTAAGRALLEYPHFVGTIHHFINTFLAMPGLRRCGIQPRAIDDDQCLRHRQRLLGRYQFSHIRGWLANQSHTSLSGIRLSSITGDTRCHGRAVFSSQTSPSARELRVLMLQSVRDGYVCYDEAFLWAHDLLDNYPDIAASLRRRFPFLFVDEVQDNSDAQNQLLQRVFAGGETVRQRFGDANQAIYDGYGEPVATDFPVAEVRRDMPDSRRFDSTIAQLAQTLAVDNGEFAGRGPSAAYTVELSENPTHAIFLFDDQSIGNVLAKYAAHVAKTFAPAVWSTCRFTAVGAIHRPPIPGRIVDSVGSYHPKYKAHLAGSEPRPKTFVEFIAAGARETASSGQTAPLVNRAATAILVLRTIAAPETVDQMPRRPHLQLSRMLNGAALTSYQEFIDNLVECRGVLTKDAWESRWRQVVLDAAVATTDASDGGEDCEEFLAWRDVSSPAESRGDTGDNIFQYRTRDGVIQVELGSIHSVKGQTHTATLVLETFLKVPQLKSIKHWLLGDRSVAPTTTTKRCLRIHYVAMTRPTHLLCLALHRDAVTGDERARFEEQGWAVIDV